VTNRGQSAQPLPIPAPVGGLNTRDALAAMPPGDASVMLNVFPYADRVETRAGYTTHATATTTSPGGGLTAIEGFRSLMEWSAKGSTQALGAYYWGENVAGTVYPKLRIYLINDDGTLTNSREAVTTGGTNTLSSLGEWTQFTSAAGTSYLLIPVTINTGAQTFTPQAYDGTNWTTPAITGVPAGTIGSHSHQGRLWFYGTADTTNAPKGLSAWYLPTGAIAGAVTEFNIGPYASRGGKIVAMRTWTLDGGDGGTDDRAVFVTDRGQAIVYAGTDPASSATWGLVGVFDIGRPAGAFPYDYGSPHKKFALKDTVAMKYGADLLFLLDDGVSSAKGVLGGREAGKDYSISTKIRSLFTDLATLVGTGNLPWKMAYLPSRRQLIAAVVTSAIDSGAFPGIRTLTVASCDWFVMNTETGAWTKFDSMKVMDALPYGSHLYFIDGASSVYKYGSAALDGASAITYETRQAYNYMGSPNNKLATLMQPMLKATGNFSLTVEADVDFNAGTISSYTSYTVASTQNLQPYISPAKYGRSFAAHLKGQTSAGVVSWYATNWIVKPAGMI
jgi:hypothetical protein